MELGEEGRAEGFEPTPLPEPVLAEVGVEVEVEGGGGGGHSRRVGFGKVRVGGGEGTR